MYTSGEAKLNNLLINLNMMYDSIKFDHKTSAQSIARLDTFILINKNRQQQTTLYTKPTNTRDYLHYKYSHPKHIKRSLSHT